MSDLVGQSVSVPGAGRGLGILRYIGHIEGKQGIFGGVELRGSTATSRGKNNGDVEGIQYFEVAQPMSGLFLPWDRIRSVNPNLPPVDKLRISSSNSRRNSVRTPTPSNRASPVPENIDKTAKASTGKSYDGLANMNTVPATISRASSAKKVSLSHSPARASRITTSSGASNSLQSLNIASPRIVSSDAYLDLKQQLLSKCRELEQKENILVEMQATIDQFTPALETYEKRLEDKSRRLKKQKSEYDKAREEWRQSLDLMLSSQQEAENLYETQINDLKAEISELQAKFNMSGQGTDTSDYERLKNKIISLQERNSELERQLFSENVNVTEAMKLEKKGDEFETYEKKIEVLTRDITSMEIIVEDLQSKLHEKDTRIAQLESELEDANTNNVENLQTRVKLLTVSDGTRENQELRASVSELEEELEDKRNQVKLQAEEIQGLKQAVESMKNSSENSYSDDEVQFLRLEQQKLKSTIEMLTKELESKRALEDSELTDLQESLEMVEQLHGREMKAKEMEVEALREKVLALQDKELRLQDEVNSLRKENTAETIVASREESMRSPRGLIEQELRQVEVISGDGSLPVYVPKTNLDPSEGRDDWCGLCERDGHDTLHCPYENDLF